MFILNFLNLFILHFYIDKFLFFLSFWDVLLISLPVHVFRTRSFLKPCKSVTLFLLHLPLRIEVNLFLTSGSNHVVDSPFVTSVSGITLSLSNLKQNIKGPDRDKKNLSNLESTPSEIFHYINPVKETTSVKYNLHTHRFQEILMLKKGVEPRQKHCLSFWIVGKEGASVITYINLVVRTEKDIRQLSTAVAGFTFRRSIGFLEPLSFVNFSSNKIHFERIWDSVSSY